MAPEGAENAGRARQIALGIVLLSVVGFFAYHTDWQEEEIDRGYSEEALRNPLLAAELFLREAGIEVETVSGLSLLDALPTPGHMIVLASSRRAMSERRVENLREWVMRGGRLVVVAEEPFDPDLAQSKDSLLDSLGIFLIEAEEELDAEAWEDEEGRDDVEEQEENASGATDEEDDAEPLRDVLGQILLGELAPCVESDSGLSFMWLNDEEEPLRMELAGERYLNAGEWSEVQASNDAGPQLLAREVDKGFVVAATSLRIWANHRIHCHDHAYLLYRLAQTSVQVHLLNDPEIPPLTEQLRAAFPLTSLSALALLLIWGASRTLRLTDRGQDRVGERRELLEHLEASAHFLWRRGQLAPSLDELRRNALGGYLSGRGGGPQQLRAAQLAELSRLSGIAPPELQAALLDPPPIARREFTEIVQTLNELRRKL